MLHDAPEGRQKTCQVCGGEFREIIDLGSQPLCDALLSDEQLKENCEVHYPLALLQCKSCTLGQLSYVVPQEKVYPLNYPYHAGISWPVVRAHRQMAEDLIARYGRGLVVDVGCNDGILLKQFGDLGCGTIGVEPTDIAKIAKERFGIMVYRATFGALLGEAIASDIGQAHLITFTNVFAHMADLGNVMKGIVTLLAEDGVLVIENHYLLDILETLQFDSIYHEHVRTYTLRSLVCLFKQYGLEVFDVQRVSRYGGNIRVHVTRQGKRAVMQSVTDMLANEERVGLGAEGVWELFRARVERARLNFRRATFLLDDAPIIGCSAPGRASTLLNFFGVTSREMPWTGELATSLKLNKYLPGSHVKVVPNSRFLEEQPRDIILLAWHYAHEISQRLRAEGVKGKLWVPLPTFREVL